MDFSFEWLDPKIGAPDVSIAQYGLTFSKNAVAAMGDPEFVMLGFDADKRVIGVKVCDKNEIKKLEFSSRKRNGYVRLNTKDFISIIERDTEFSFLTTKRYTGKWNDADKLLLIYLDHPKSGYYEKDEAEEDIIDEDNESPF